MLLCAFVVPFVTWVIRLYDGPPMSLSDPNVLEIAPGVAVPLSVTHFTFSRSGGPGGQNVNKVSSKAMLCVVLADLAGHLDGATLDRLSRLAGSHLTLDGRIVLTCDESRSQHANKATCLQRLRELIVAARVRPKRRRKTKPSRGAKERRLQSKKQRGEIKQSRQQRFD